MYKNQVAGSAMEKIIVRYIMPGAKKTFEQRPEENEDICVQICERGV